MAKAATLAVALLTGACQTQPPPPAPTQTVNWQRLGSWSGREGAQTEAFVGLTGALRIQWKAKGDAAKGPGAFRLVLCSAISGRPLRSVVDETGSGEGTAYVAEDPRIFYILVESANVDWSFTVEEAAFTSQADNPIRP